MTNTRATAVPILRPDAVHDLIIRPTVETSVLGQIATTVYIDAPALHVPKMTDLDVADWVAEGQEIPIADVSFGGQTITPARLVGGSLVTDELIEDSSPEAATLIGQSLSRDLARALDASFFGAKGANVERPAGLLDLTGHTVLTAASLDVPDVFFAAEAAAATAGTTIDAWVCDPDTASAVGRLTMLGGQLEVRDVTVPARRQILGVPVLTSRHVQPDTLWGFQRSSTLLVVRRGADVEASTGTFFMSFRTALRARLRASWGFLDPASVIRINVTP